MNKELIVIGGGLAGCEAAWQAASRGIRVRLFEMRPGMSTGAHQSAGLAELVCSNSLGSDLADRAPGLLKAELRQLGSLLMACAGEAAVPAGSSLAVDRDRFSTLIEERLSSHELIEIIRDEVREIPNSPTIIASGPLTSSALSKKIAELTGKEHLFFFDAISPIVHLESIDMSKAFRASRYARGEQEEGDYINCPLNQEEYETFVRELVSAERISLKSFEQAIEQGVKAGTHHFFEGCLPVEILAGRNSEALAYGPLRPVGLRDPRTGKRPYAVVQLRQDDLAGSLYNLVGFQTNLTFPEQRRILRLIPGLEQAEFARYGQMHRNTFIFSPALLDATLQYRHRKDLFFAGQITGVEGYAGNIATGLLAGWNAARYLNEQDLVTLPGDTMLGALCNYISHAAAADFQPMKANFGLLPPLGGKIPHGKRLRGNLHAERARSALEAYLKEIGEYAPQQQ